MENQNIISYIKEVIVFNKRDLKNIDIKIETILRLWNSGYTIEQINNSLNFNKKNIINIININREQKNKEVLKEVEKNGNNRKFRN